MGTVDSAYLVSIGFLTSGMNHEDPFKSSETMRIVDNAYLVSIGFLTSGMNHEDAISQCTCRNTCGIKNLSC